MHGFIETETICRKNGKEILFLVSACEMKVSMFDIKSKSLIFLSQPRHSELRME